MNLITRIITSVTCPKCKHYIKTLKAQGYSFEEYSADDKENQEELDKWQISSMPVVQIVEHQEDSDVLRFQFLPGMISSRAIETKKKRMKRGD